MATVKYIRVSTKEQNEGRQLHPTYKNYMDKCSGYIPFAKRIEGKKLLKDAKAGKVKHVIVNRIDRLGRSTKDILETIEEFKQLGVCIESEAEGLKTCDDKGNITPIAQLVINLMASLAEFENEMRLETIYAGIQKAKERGAYKSARKGRKETPDEFLSKKVNQTILHKLKAGMSYRQIEQQVKYKDSKGNWHNASKRTIGKVKEYAIAAGLLLDMTKTQRKYLESIYKEEKETNPNLPKFEDWVKTEI